MGIVGCADVWVFMRSFGLLIHDESTCFAHLGGCLGHTETVVGVVSWTIGFGVCSSMGIEGSARFS